MKTKLDLLFNSYPQQWLKVKPFPGIYLSFWYLVVDVTGVSECLLT